MKIFSKNKAGSGLKSAFIMVLMSVNLLALAGVCTAREGSRLNIVIADFQGKNGVSMPEASAVSDSVRAAFVKMDNFNVTNRQNMDEVLAEQKFQTLGITDAKNSSEMGRILNAQRIVTGKVSMLGTSYVVTADIVDVETGKIINSADSQAASIEKLINKTGMLSNSLAGVKNESDRYKYSDKASDTYESLMLDYVSKVKFSAASVYSDGRSAYAADYEKTHFRIYDLMDTASPKKMSKLKAAGEDVLVLDDMAFVADRKKGVLAFNISNIRKPKKKRLYKIPGTKHSLFLHNEILYVAAGSEGVYLLNIRDTSNLSKRSELKTNGEALEVYVADGIGFIAEGRDGISIVDFTNPTVPKLKGSYRFREPVNSAVGRDGYAYCAVQGLGVAVLDISDSEKPEVVSKLITKGSANALFLDGPYLYLADGKKGLVVIDITDPLNPFETAKYSVKNLNDVYVRDGYVYLASNKYLTILKARKP